MIRLAAVVRRLRLDLGGLRVAVPLFMLVLSWPLWGTHIVKRFSPSAPQSATMISTQAATPMRTTVAPLGFAEYINDKYQPSVHDVASDPALHNTYAQGETPHVQRP